MSEYFYYKTNLIKNKKYVYVNKIHIYYVYR